MIGQTVSHYRILEKLGGGGMGVVYKAEDLRLGRYVSLKFLPEELSKEPLAIERFQREARAASSLNHPHICTIYDVDQYEGQSFIVMEYLEGHTLKHRISGKPIDIERIPEYGHQMADALEAAHAKAIIHRDIKPANIFITDRGQVKLLDFGLAKLLPERKGAKLALQKSGAFGTTTQETHLTSDGVALGTVAYMSPEQVRGQELDERTDVFSLGLVLYEMSTGQRAFTGNTSGVIFDAILNRAPISPVRLNPLIPLQLEHIISKALEKDRDLRYRTASDIRADLQRLKRDTDSARALPYLSGPSPSQTVRKHWPHFLWAGVLVVGLLLLALNVGNVRQRLFGGAGAGRIDSIAVLPFANVSKDPNTEYLSDGITESLINSLSQLPNLAVMARSSVFRYKGRDVDPQAVAKDLKVQAVVTGRIVQRGDQIIVSSELIDARTNHNLWGDRYDRKMSDLLSVQQDITGAISSHLRERLSTEPKKTVTHGGTSDPEAYQLYLKGLYHWEKRTPESLEKSKDYFNQAIQRDPNYALAY